MYKVSIIGAGNVGSLTAMRIAEADLADVVVLDVAEAVCQGKARDIQHSVAALGGISSVIGTADYEDTANSDIAVITAGFPRKEGMSREDLLNKNAGIVESVVKQVISYSPKTLILMVTNPLDIMTYLAYKVSGFNSNRVFGMAGVLDSARFKILISEKTGVSIPEVEAMVLGTHGDTMVPLLSSAKAGVRLVKEILSKEETDTLISETKKEGGRIVSLLGKGSAYFAPSASIFRMVRAVLKDTKEIMPVSVYAGGKYDLEGLYIGLPTKLGREGIEEIVELELSPEELSGLNRAAEGICGYRLFE